MSSKSDNCLSFRVAGDAEIGTRAEVVLTLSNGYESWDYPIAFTIEKASLGVDADISVIGKEPYELVYPGEVPAFEKYDGYVPDELVRKGFAYGVLDIAGMKERVLSWAERAAGS